MTFPDLISNMFVQNAKKYSIVHIKSEQTDAQYDPAPFVPGQAYCRIWLVEMCLQNSMELFNTRYPVVHSAIRFNHGSQDVTIPYIAGPGFLKELTRNNLDKIIQLNHALTPLFPYNHGLVELQAGLFSMKTGDWVNKFINTLGRFSKLLPVPELSSVMHLAAPVYSGIEDLLDIGDGRLELGCQQTFSDTARGNILKPGYFAVILADHEKVEDLHLCIVNDQLKAWQPEHSTKHQPLSGISYMLFFIEKTESLEDYWEALTRINNLVNMALKAVAGNDTKKINEHKINIKTTVFSSPDLTKKDRLQMVKKIWAYLDECRLESTRASNNVSLYAIMQRPMPEPDPELEAELEEWDK